MRFTVCIKNRALPIGKPLDKVHSSDASHQIHLAGSDQTAHDWRHRDPIWRDGDMILFQQLCNRVIAGNVQPDDADVRPSTTNVPCFVGMKVRLFSRITKR